MLYVISRHTSRRVDIDGEGDVASMLIVCLALGVEDICHDEIEGDDGASEEDAGVIVLVVGVILVLEDVHGAAESIVIAQLDHVMVVAENPVPYPIAMVIGAFLDDIALVGEGVRAMAELLLSDADGVDGLGEV